MAEGLLNYTRLDDPDEVVCTTQGRPRDVGSDGCGKRLDGELGRLEPGGWTAQVRSALGRTIPAAEVPWMRIREVWLHATDLGTDILFDEIPDSVVDLLLDDVCANLSGKDGCPSVTVAPADRATAWRLGAGDPCATAGGRAADLVGWVTGRLPRPDLPPLPGWL
jgi:maleylpyruvate isomerase